MRALLEYNNRIPIILIKKNSVSLVKSNLSSLLVQTEYRNGFSAGRKTIVFKKIGLADIRRNLGHISKILSAIRRPSNQLVPMSHFHMINRIKVKWQRDFELNKSNSEVILLKASYEIVPDVNTKLNPLKSLPQQSTDLTPLSNNMKYHIDNSIDVQKALCGLALKTKYSVDNHELPNTTTICARFSLDKTINSKTVSGIDHPSNPMQTCNKIMHSSMATKMHQLGHDQTHMPLLLEPLVDPYYPLTVDLIIITYQRMGYNFNIPRGHIANMLYQKFSRHYPPQELDFIASVLRVENPQGIGGFDFVKEMNTALHHMRDIFRKNNITLKEYRMAENNPKGSLAAMQSKLHTGQHNNDCTLPMLIPPTNVEIVLRVDIKHHELDRKKDLSNCYVRVSYNIKGYHDDTPKINAYLDLVKEDLANYITQDDETFKIHRSLADSQKDTKFKINDLNNYILKNAHNKPHARKTMVIFIERVISEKHAINLSFIKDQDITLDSSSYDVKDKKSTKFKKDIEDLSNSPSGKAFIEHLEKNYPSPRHFSNKPLDFETYEIL